MRVGVDVSPLVGNLTGIGRYTHELLRRLTESGHEWFLYSHDHINANYTDRKNVHLRLAKTFRFLPRTVSVQTTIPLQAKQDKVDLFWSPTHRLPTLLSKKIARVLTIHDLVWKRAGETMRPLNRFLDAALMPEGIRIADRIITVSEHTALDLKTEFPDSRHKIRTIPLGISSLLAAAPRESLASMGLTGQYFLFVGTLEPRKNLGRLISAFSVLPQRLREQVCLVIAGGDGWGGVNVASIAERFGVERNIRVLGYVSEEQLAALYSHALFLAMPSLYEGFGLPLLEAMARGIPVLASDCSSMPEVVGNAGVLVDPYDVSSIARGIVDILENDARRSELSKLSLLNASRFSWDKAAKETLEVFEDAIETRKKLVGF
ncbi:glycosyltransferase family 4 protein [Metapseudomonas otitidis]|uniref:glycosyltransferase family 4 protein n=1 Tax=Metapseudomonas otitidis TaxID=319939 RepID=UPI00244A6B9F|nr:glycosyltransferase family 1 protein [Pseudomonas otitidis]MDH0339080.1 glycosyltransferase family 4 protein [Pseudomonas otitidis]